MKKSIELILAEVGRTMAWCLGVVWVLVLLMEWWWPGLVAAGINPAVLVGLTVVAAGLIGLSDQAKKNPWPGRLVVVLLAVYAALTAMAWTAGPDWLRVFGAVLAAVAVVGAMW